MAKTPQEDLMPTRWSLVNRLKDWNDQTSWQQFFDAYSKLIYSVALRQGLTESEAQEVVQETVISVAKKMPGFKADPGAGSFRGWLMQLTRRRIIDQLRKRPRHQAAKSTRRGETARTATIERIPDPAGIKLDAVWNEEWEKNIFDAALDRVKSRVNPKQFQIFHLLIARQLPPDKVAEIARVKVDNVYLVKHRVAALFKEEVQRLENHTI